MDKNSALNEKIKISEDYVINFLTQFKDISFEFINISEISREIVDRLPSEDDCNLKYVEFLTFVSDYCASKVSFHPEYNKLASHICVLKLHLSTYKDIREIANILYNNYDIHNVHTPLISEKLYNNYNKYYIEINKEIDYDRDYFLDYFGIKTLEKSYLIRINKDGKKTIIERPQHMFMRVAFGIHENDIISAFETYNHLSQKYFTHATPTLFNAGTNHMQLSSCFVENTEVFTLNEGIKNIQDVKIGDEVVTHTGSIQKVVQLHKNLLNDRKIYKLRVSKTKEIFVTENHKFMSSTDMKTGGWNAVLELKEGNYIAIPNYKGNNVDLTIDISKYLEDFDRNKDVSIKYETDEKNIWSVSSFTHSNISNITSPVTCSKKSNKKSNKVNRYWTLDKDFANLMGMFIGDGNIITKKNSREEMMICGINFTIFDKNTKGIDFIKNTGKRVFGTEPNVHKMKNQNVTQIMYNSNVIGSVFFALFGKGFDGKFIPAIMFKLKQDAIYGFLAGLITTDGCISKDGIISVQMSNKNLTNQLYHLFRNRGIDVSINKAKKMPKMATQQPYTLSIPKIKDVLDQIYKYYEDDRLDLCYKKLNNPIINKSRPLVLNGNKYLRIESLELSDQNPEYVYTLGISEDHSYNVEGLVCENCFLMGCDDDLDNILDRQKEMGMISKWSGGIGIHLSSIRGKGSLIRGTNGLSDGIIPLCIYTCKLSRYVNQGGKRGGAFAIYLEVHHPDIYEFCELRIPNTGNDDNRARDLFLALWVCDLFMKRVKNDEMWSLMCPDECPNLNKTHGKKFEKLYIKYEEEKRYKRQVKARDLFEHILTCQLSSGLPYVCFKDNANLKSNQQNLGTICSSNLCSEIIEYSDAQETAVCNLASICLPRFIENKQFNYEKLQEVSRMCVRNLNKVIDLNFYPTDNAKKSNMRTRPIGIGVQGVADVYNIMEYAFESEEATKLNKRIFETIYYSALSESCKLAQKDCPYSTFQGSPFSEGKLQFHLWGMKVGDLETKHEYDWYGLIEDIKKYGTRNSLLTALMPTATTSQIMKYSECFEPYMSNIFTRSTLAGEFIVINENLIKTLEKHNLWNKDMREKILENKGSVQNIEEIPQDVKNIFKTAFEIKLKSIVSQSADRGPFIDQSQSMNLFLEEQDRTKLRSALFYAWERGLKTGMYYLRTTPAVDPLKFGLEMKEKKKETKEENLVCRREKGCMVCGA